MTDRPLANGRINEICHACELGFNNPTAPTPYGEDLPDARAAYTNGQQAGLFRAQCAKTKITPDILNQRMELAIIRSSGHISCAYLNDLRIAGGKPCVDNTPAATFSNITLRDIVRAIPELWRALSLDYLGNPVPAPADISSEPPHHGS